MMRSAAIVCWVLSASLGCGGATTTPDGAMPTNDAGAQPSADAAMTIDSSTPSSDLARAADPCVAGACAPGVWVDVTPSGIDLDANLSCGNYGTLSVQVDPSHPETLYAEFNCVGIYESTDYGQTWNGPINTGMNGTTVSDCAGGITVGQDGTLYESCIRGGATGFWSSTNGGVDWTRYNIAPGAGRQDYFPPAVDPYDAKHLIMAAHEQNAFVESIDAGHKWTSISIDSGMIQIGGTGAVLFIDTGTAATTRTTWLWLAQGSGGNIGTWRTTTGGTSWTHVDKNEKGISTYQIYQPDKTGIVFMAGQFSALGNGVLRSTDYGQTWAHVGQTTAENVVFGTSKNIYSMNGFAIGAGQMFDPSLETATTPATGTWTTPGTPAAMSQGPASAAVTSDGQHSIVFAACYNAGLWRYVEP